MPAGVVGFEAFGKISADDYRDTLLPAVVEAARSGEIRLLLVMSDFEGMTGGAVREDVKLGVEHLRAWKRTALVTDIEWMAHLTALFGWMSPGETKTFPLAARDEALSWVAG